MNTPRDHANLAVARLTLGKARANYQAGMRACTHPERTIPTRINGEVFSHCSTCEHTLVAELRRRLAEAQHVYDQASGRVVLACEVVGCERRGTLRIGSNAEHVRLCRPHAKRVYRLAQRERASADPTRIFTREELLEWANTLRI